MRERGRWWGRHPRLPAAPATPSLPGLRSVHLPYNPYTPTRARARTTGFSLEGGRLAPQGFPLACVSRAGRPRSPISDPHTSAHPNARTRERHRVSWEGGRLALQSLSLICASREARPRSPFSGPYTPYTPSRARERAHARHGNFPREGGHPALQRFFLGFYERIHGHSSDGRRHL